MGRAAVERLNERIIACRRCPRLVAWREQVACEKRFAFRDEAYWGRPVPSFGDPRARVLVCGLAPAAHGGNRTGRVFTGDRSGDWLFGALYRAGFANQPTSTHRDDGLRLTDCYITACVHCAPPANRPTTEERDNCLTYLVEELGLLKRICVIVCLGAFAWDGVLRALRTAGQATTRKPRFGHAIEAIVGPYKLLGCYHPSQQNTFTGRLTQPMLDAVFTRARSLAKAANSGVRCCEAAMRHRFPEPGNDLTVNLLESRPLGGSISGTPAFACSSSVTAASRRSATTST
jgi:uracil-DNA glycosylase family 4